MALSRKKISLVHVAKNQLGLTDEQYRAVLWHCGGATSSKQLNSLGFDAVMAYMTALGFRSDWTKKTYGRRAGMATPSQVELIRDLWTEYTDGEGTDLTLGKWLNGTFHVSALRFVDGEMVGKVIAALKDMTARERLKKEEE